MIASLMMYARPELAAAHNRYWNLIRANLTELGIKSPATLSQKKSENSVWTDPALVLSQTCGMPYKNDLHNIVTLVGTPDFIVEGCPPAYYRSAFVVRDDDKRTDFLSFKQATFAFNHQNSQSGYNAAYWHLRRFDYWFDKQVQTHQHIVSAQAVAEHNADIACIDAVSWRLMTRYDDFANCLRVLAWADPTPGLPYIAAAGADAQGTFKAIEKSIAQLTKTDRAALSLNAIIQIPAQAYLSIPNLPL